jgi:hypothetical protein
VGYGKFSYTGNKRVYWNSNKENFGIRTRITFSKSSTQENYVWKTTH